MRVRAEAPCRIDLAGGTLDINPIYLYLSDPCTVNLAVSITAVADVRKRPGRRVEIEAVDRGLRAELDLDSRRNPGGLELVARIVRELAPDGGLSIRTLSHSPAGAGLGASSALCVALCSAILELRGRALPVDEMVRLCVDLEASVLGAPAGYQDFYPAANGGLQEIRYAPGRVGARRLRADLEAIARRLILAYTGVPHHSGMNNWEVIKRFIDGDAEVRSAMEEIGYAAAQIAGALSSGDWAAVPPLLAREWHNRRRLWPGLSTPEIDELVGEAETLGGAGKVCGAGGGGCVLLWHDGRDGPRLRLEAAARRLGASLLEWSPADEGCRISVFENETLTRAD